MLLVVDANVANKRFEFVAPEFLMVEVEKHASDILKKTGLSSEELGKVFDFLEKEIEFVSFEEFAEFFSDAKKISPDPNDVQYFALALKLNGAIWSNDKPLKKQFAIEVLSTGDVIKLMQFEYAHNHRHYHKAQPYLRGLAVPFASPGRLRGKKRRTSAI